MKKYKILENICCSQESINDVVNQIHNYGFGKLNKVLSDNYCKVLADASDEIEKSKLKLIKKNHFSTKSLSESIKNGQTFIRNVILDNPELFIPLIDLSPIMSVLKELFKETFIIDGIGISKSNKKIENGLSRSSPHVDSHIVSPKKNHILDVVACICLDDFTEKNGATKIWPKSHKSGVLIHKEAKYKNNIPPGSVDVLCSRGDIFFFVGQTWHQIGDNKNEKRRWGILSHYKRWWIKPSLDYTKCGSSIYSKLNDDQKILLGFTSRSPSHGSGRLKTLMNVKKLPDDYDTALII